MLITLFARVVVNICERIKLIDNDIDIVATDAMALGCYPFAFIHTCDGVELTAADFMFNAVEMGGNGVHTSRITYKDDLVGQKLRLQMKVKTRAVAIDDQL